MFMKRTTVILSALLALAAFVMPSCKNDYFDQHRYEELLSNSFPVSELDTLHDWNLTKTVTAVFDLAASPEGEYVIAIYDIDPTGPREATRLASGVVSGYGSLKFNLGKDDSSSAVYVVVYNRDVCVARGLYNITNNTVYVQSEAGFNQVPPLLTQPNDVEYTFCFEETYPESGDFDFNDLVLGVSYSKSAKAMNDSANYIDITVRLRASGGNRPLACSMRLADIKPNMVSPTFTMPRAEWKYYRYGDVFFDDPKGEVRLTKDGCVRIDLFNDSHYALNGGKLDVAGTLVPRYAINTLDEMDDPEWEKADVKVSTYRLAFNDDEAFNDFNFSNLDIFITTSYNASFYEIHRHPFFGMRAINDYPTTIGYIPWALMVPDKIQYPIEGTPIGKYSSDVNYYEGAYQQGQYSFGAWARNRNNTEAQGWYHYPNRESVYPMN